MARVSHVLRFDGRDADDVDVGNGTMEDSDDMVLLIVVMVLVTVV